MGGRDGGKGMGESWESVLQHLNSEELSHVS